MYTLGINSVYHDSSACLVRDGVVVAAAEDERFTGIKHGKRPIPFSTYELPFHAIHYCLKEEGIMLSDIDHVAYSYNPDLFSQEHQGQEILPLAVNPKQPHPEFSKWESVWDPLFISSILNAEGQLTDGAPHHLKSRFRSGTNKFLWHYVDHHLAHAASAFFASPFRRAAVWTLDGRGEKATTSYYLGDQYDLQLINQVVMPHSLGLLYEQVTSYLGFLHSSDEYKVMALASYGKPRFKKDFEEMITVLAEGDYRIADMNLEERFGPPRERGAELLEVHYDIAHSLQVVLEETALKLAAWLHRRTECDRLCLAGGVALNCVLNARLRDRGPFKEIWVQPAAGDAGTSLGAALWIDVQERRPIMNGHRSFAMDHAYLGPAFSDDEIERFLRWSKLPYRRLDDVAEQTADLLLEDKVIGWFQGRMEFGPRALGGRSIIASPIHADMQARLNDIKDREDFRPVAPVVMEEEVDQWFVNGEISPFMLFVYDVVPDRADRIPAVRHVDGTARIQTVRREQNVPYYDLLSAFRRRTGVPILINTSFNTRGKPIVCTPRDAVECFWTSPLDALVIGSFLLEKG